jgi:prevent-host-death family protein
MQRVAKADARKRFADIVTGAGRRGERIKITHYGKTLAVLIPKADLQKLEECEHARASSRSAQRRKAG